MTDYQRDRTSERRRTTVDQTRDTFEQAFELQRSATKMALSILEIQDTAGRQGLEFTKSMMQTYLQGVESMAPAMEHAMEEGMEHAVEEGMEAATAPARMAGQEFQESSGQYPQQFDTTRAERQPPGMDRYGTPREAERRPQQQPQETMGRRTPRPEPGGYGETGQWIPEEQAQQHPRQEYGPRPRPGPEPQERRGGDTRYDRDVQERPPQYQERTEPPYRRPRDEPREWRDDTESQADETERARTRQPGSREPPGVNIPGGETSEMGGRPPDVGEQREEATHENESEDEGESE